MTLIKALMKRLFYTKMN